ncbi:unnamed protein product [Cochlearia groenlandica]
MVATANLGFVTTPTISFSSSSSLCPKSTSVSMGFTYRLQKLDFSKRASRIYERDSKLLLPIKCYSSSSSSESDNSNVVVKEKSVSVILLAGGQGKRMKMSMPKQYIPLLGQPIALYSFFTFSRMPQVKEIVVVCDPFFRDIFQEYEESIDVDLRFALPGKERQDSVHSGLEEISVSSKLVCIHDSARPLVDTEDVEKVLKDGLAVGAAVLGVPAKATIKEVNSDSLVVKTLDRKTLWEMQTPQVIKPELLKRGFELVKREGLEVTDDVSIVEYLKHPVFVTQGSYTNIKVTTPDDLLLAERILSIDE